jgi:hypothetical protein
MYENEERNKRELSAFYEKKEEAGRVGHRRDTTQSISQSDDCEHFQVSVDSHSGELKQDSSKKIKRLKKPSIQPEGKRISNLSEKYMTENVILEKEEDSHLSGEDVYLEMSTPRLTQSATSSSNSSRSKSRPRISSKYPKSSHSPS